MDTFTDAYPQAGGGGQCKVHGGKEGGWRGAVHIIKSSTGSTEFIYGGLLIFSPFVVDTEIEPDE